MRLVNDKNRSTAPLGLGNQHVIQRRENFGLRFTVTLQIEIPCNHLQKFRIIDPGIENESKLYTLLS